MVISYYRFIARYQIIGNYYKGITQSVILNLFAEII